VAVQFNEPLEVTILQIAQCRALIVKHDDSGLTINTDLFDNNGNLVAVIKNDELHALPWSGAYLEHRNDLSTLVIMKRDPEELLNVRYLNRRTVRIRGQFGCPGHPVVPVKDGEPVPHFIFGAGACMNMMKGTRITGAVFAVDPASR
jgi:hypothetical protein